MGSVAIVPAAGKGERFGAPFKLLADLDGEPLLNRTIRSLLDGGVDRVVIVIAPGISIPSVTLLEHAAVDVVVNPDPSRGMFSSIQAGVAAAEGDPIVVLPADMPYVKTETISALIAAARLGEVVTPRYQSRRGHPVALPARLRAHILSDAPTSTLSALLDRAAPDRLEMDVDDPGVLKDVDTKADIL